MRKGVALARRIDFGRIVVRRDTQDMYEDISIDTHRKEHMR